MKRKRGRKERRQALLENLEMANAAKSAMTGK